MANEYRKDFPIFNGGENRSLIYFDNAATTQKPSCVIEAMRKYYEEENANPLRGLYSLSEKATRAYEDARHTVAAFIGSRDCEVVFTRNASESLNLVAYTWGLSNVGRGDEILVSITEHHSNILPWQMVAQKNGAKIVYMEPDRLTGEFPESEFRKINKKTRLVAISEVSNVLGTRLPVKKIVDAAHSVGAVCVVDGAQGAPHVKIDVMESGADFFAFSGHKILAPMGIGVLYGKKSLLEQMPPFLRGGEMIEYVTRDGATWADLPHKFEAGTVNCGGAVGLAAAIKYVESIGIEKIAAHEQKLAEILMQGMKEIPHVNIIGSPDPKKHSGIVTFTIDGVHPHDIASLLDTEKIAIRAGHHCAQPLGEYLALPASARASLYIYNDQDEVELFLNVLSKIRKMSGYKD